MQDWLIARTQATPHATALIIGATQWDYRELNRMVDAYAIGLIAHGVTPGQHVALFLPNGLAYLCLVHACARVGAVLVPLNTRLTPAELTWQLTQSDAQVLVYGDAYPAVTAEMDGVAGCRVVEVTALQQPGKVSDVDSAFLSQTQFQLDI